MLYEVITLSISIRPERLSYEYINVITSYSIHYTKLYENYIPKDVNLLPNTSGARNAEEAIKIARIAREAGCGDFIKIEIINDMKSYNFV